MVNCQLLLPGSRGEHDESAGVSPIVAPLDTGIAKANEAMDALLSEPRRTPQRRLANVWR
jgi:hypothetical protein